MANFKSQFVTVSQTGIYYKCEFCAMFVNEGNIFEHITNVHCGSNFFKCQLCLHYTGNKLQSLFQHQQDKHNIDIHYLICPMCIRYITPELKEMVSHLSNHFTKRTLHVCKYCNFTSESSLDSHISEKHSGTMCCFKNCRMIFKDIYQLFSHYIDHHFPRVDLYFCCTDCDMMYRKIHSLQQHMGDKHGIYEDDDDETKTSIEIVCNLCAYETSCKDSFKRHTKQKHPHIWYNCLKECGYESGSFFSFYQHFFDKHLSKKIPYYNCFECETCFKDAHALMQHMRDKHNAINYCSDCDSVYDDFEAHLNGEHIILYVSCAICNEEFEDKEDLKDHLENEHSINVSQYV